MGKMHASVYRMLPGVEIAAFVDARPDCHRKYLKENPRPVYRNLKELFAREEVDIVDICLPTYLHCEFAREAIRNGRHVFCEKPLALSIQEARDTEKLADMRGVKFMVGHCIRFWPEYQYLENLVKTRKMGRILSLTMERLASRPIWSVDNWLQDERRSMGCALDMHIHDSDFAVHLFGMPEAVSSIGTRDHAGYSWINTHYHYPFVQVNATGGWNFPQKWGFKMAYRAVFERGSVDYDSTQSPSIRLVAEGGNERRIKVGAPSIRSKAKVGGNISAPAAYFNELKYFVDCVKKDRNPKIATASDATASLQVCLAEIQSAETRRPVVLK